MASYIAPLDASEHVLADGRVVVPGEAVDLSADDVKDEHNKRLIDAGQLIKAPSKKEKEASS